MNDLGKVIFRLLAFACFTGASGYSLVDEKGVFLPPEVPLLAESDLAEKQTDIDEVVYEILEPGGLPFDAAWPTHPVYVQIKFKPRTNGSIEKNLEASIFGAAIGFDLNHDRGVNSLQLKIGDGEGNWAPAKIKYALNTLNEYDDWISILVRIDPEQKTFDLYQGKALWMANNPLEEDRTQLVLYAKEGKNPRFRLPEISLDHPGFEDRDADGIPDDFELRYGEDIHSVSRDTVDPLTGRDVLSLYMNTLGKYEK